MADVTLRDAARSGGRSFGAAVQAERLRTDPAFRDLVLTHCDTLTPELALKWAAIQPRAPGATSGEALSAPAPMDALASFARAHRRRIHGHTLLWHRSVPDWAGEAMAQDGWAVVRRYVAEVVGRYGDVIDRWDVVNEPIDTVNGADGLRRSVFLDRFGPEYVRRALATARALAPRAQLLINEFDIEYPIPEQDARRRRLLRLIDDLRRSGTPLDGIGVQGHLRLDRGPIDQAGLARFLGELSDRGLAIHVTELDVRETAFDRPVDQRDQAVADAVRGFLDVALDQPATRSVATWGLSDRYYWLNEDGEVGAGRPLGSRGLPLDAALRPKPFFRTLADALRRARRASPMRQRAAEQPIGMVA